MNFLNHFWKQFFIVLEIHLPYFITKNTTKEDFKIYSTVNILSAFYLALVTLFLTAAIF